MVLGIDIASLHPGHIPQAVQGLGLAPAIFNGLVHLQGGGEVVLRIDIASLPQGHLPQAPQGMGLHAFQRASAGPPQEDVQSLAVLFCRLLSIHRFVEAEPRLEPGCHSLL